MEEYEEENEGGGNGFSRELLESYLRFARRAIRERWRTSVAIVVVGLILTLLTTVYWPRTFSCTTTLMAVGNAVLDGRDGTNALVGAVDLIQRHENLEMLIRSTNLIQKSAERRPPLLKLKDRIIKSIAGEMNDKTRMMSMIGTLEAKINASTDRGVLSIKVDWSDPRTTAELAEAARQSFLSTRHAAEISAFEDKMAILDGHASNLRDEIGSIAQKLKASRDEQLSQVREHREPSPAPSAGTDVHAAIPRRPASVEPDALLPVLKEKLDSLRAKLAAVEADRDRRIREESAKLDEMKLRLTPMHPEVVTEAERVAMLEQVPSDLSLMRTEVKDLEGEISARNSLSRQSTDSAPAFAGGPAKAAQISAGAEPLPADITELLRRDNLDPALSAQLDGAVTKYTALRTDMLSTRIDLDTAQAAFNHRYQVIVPAEIPTKPDKPKVPLLIAGGVGLALLLALLVPVLAALKSGIITERWQVEHLRIPVLAELQLPPHSSD